jgi:hypothetical protein
MSPDPIAARLATYHDRLLIRRTWAEVASVIAAAGLEFWIDDYEIVLGNTRTEITLTELEKP